MMRPIKKGSTDQSVVIRIVDSTDGTPETAVEHNTSGIDLWYRREGATKTSITEAALAALDTAHTDGGIEHIGDGYYRLDPPDAAFASGANGVMIGGTVTGMVVIGCYVPLVDYDPQDAVRLGMTALPNAAANATGGLGGFVIRGATAQAGAAGTITLDASASAVDDYYNGCKVYIVSGTGALQERQIIDYVGSTKVATVYLAGPPVQGAQWATNPDNTSVFVITPESIVPAAITTTSGAVTVLSSSANTLRKNVAFDNYAFKMVDATDLKTAETGVTVTAQRSIDGAAFASCANAVSEIANGFYKINLANTDLNGNCILLRFTGTGCHPTEVIIITQPT